MAIEHLEHMIGANRSAQKRSLFKRLRALAVACGAAASALTLFSGPALAADGCADFAAKGLNGRTYGGLQDGYFGSNLSFSAGEVINYSVQTAGTTGNIEADGGAFIIGTGGPWDVGGYQVYNYSTVGNEVNISGSYTIPVTSNYTVWAYSPFSTVGSVTVSLSCGAAKTDQTITFANPGAQNFGTTPTLTAAATSGLPVSFTSSTTGVCTITPGGTLTFAAAGTCTINADQAGNGTYNGAPQVPQTFTVNAVVPGAPTGASASAGNTQATVSFTAPSSNGGSSITGYTVTSNPGGWTGSGAGSPITVTSLTNGTAYTFTVTATNGAGTSALSAASSPVTPKASQTITFANPGAQLYGTTPMLTAAATSGLPVSFTSSTTGVCTITAGGALTFVTIGICTINAHQAGDAAFNAAPDVPQTFTVNAVLPGAPTGVSASAGNTQATVSFTAPSSNGGSSITGYTVTASPGGWTGSGAGSPIAVIGLTNGMDYTFTVTATNGAGTGAASASSTPITPKASQTIAFAHPGAHNFGTTPTLMAIATSGLTVDFSSSTTGVCTITPDGTLTFITAGTCTINAHQAGNARFIAAPDVPRSFLVNATIPGPPTDVTASAGNGQATISFTPPSNNGGAPNTGYIVMSSPGNLSTFGYSSPITLTGLTNGTTYAFIMRAVNPGAKQSVLSAVSNRVTPKASQTITFANPGAQLYGTTPTLTAAATSGLPVSFTSSTTGVCTITAGGALTFVTAGTCSINAHQAGDAAFSAAPQVPQTFTVSAVRPGAPTDVSASAGDGQATISFTAPSSNGGATITSYTVTSNPGGWTAGGGSSPITVIGLTNGTAYTFTVTATNSAGTGAWSAASNSVTPQPVLPAPIATDSSATVAANSSDTAIALSLSGGAASSVAIGTQATNGTATASGTTITYTPNAGYSGSDSFTYTATNATGTSAEATVSITVTAPTLVLTPAAGALANGTVGTDYTGVSVTASGGTSPYTYAVTAGALPADLTLTSSGAITGTPTASGTFNVTITATDANAATGSAAYTLQIARAPAVFVFTPAGGALSQAMAGEDYSAQISASGGTGALTYSVSSGSLPGGMVLNISTGELTGPLASGAEGTYTFTIQVSDGNGDTGTATYTLVVGEREITVTNKQIEIPAGVPPTNVNLTEGATGGPFVAADIVSVQPANAGTVSILNGEYAQAVGASPVGWYLKFDPNPAYSGTVSVQFRLTSALGISNIGIVTYTIGYDPAAVVDEIGSLVRGFVQTRQSLIASNAKVPGLLERRRMHAARGPLSSRLSPSANGMTLNFATSSAQANAALNAADGLVDVAPDPFNMWIDGTLMVHNRAQNGNRWGSFGMVSVGADYLVTDKALIGLSFHYDRMTDPTHPDALLTGNGWLAGPYASFEIGNGVFWDSSLLYGGSANTIDTAFWDGSFDTRRWLFDTSITGKWQLDAATALTPKLRAVYLNETVMDYRVENGTGTVLPIDGFTTEQLRVSLGAEIARQFTLDDGSTLTPTLGITGGFSGLDGSGAFGQVSTGLSYHSPESWTLNGGLLFNIEGNGQTSVGGKVGFGVRF